MEIYILVATLAAFALLYAAYRSASQIQVTAEKRAIVLRYSAEAQAAEAERKPGVGERMAGALDRTALVEWIKGLPWRVTVVLHVNHAQELEDDAVEAIARLRGTGALLLNQSVLLRGVNDDAATLTALSKRLHALGVLPYYLHLTDAVNGTAHFDVDEPRGRALIDTLARGLPGYLVPRLVREVPGEDAKVVLAAGLMATANRCRGNLDISRCEPEQVSNC